MILFFLNIHTVNKNLVTSEPFSLSFVSFEKDTLFLTFGGTLLVTSDFSSVIFSLFYLFPFLYFLFSPPTHVEGVWEYGKTLSLSLSFLSFFYTHTRGVVEWRAFVGLSFYLFSLSLSPTFYEIYFQSILRSVSFIIPPFFISFFSLSLSFSMFSGIRTFTILIKFPRETVRESGES